MKNSLKVSRLLDTHSLDSFQIDVSM